jgi:CheY-like chemotaxis protein
MAMADEDDLYVDDEDTLPLGVSRGAVMPANPRLEAVPAARAEFSTLGYGAGGERRGDIAVVGVDHKTQESLRILLEPVGYRVFAVADASRAAKLCEQVDVRLVFADLKGGFSAALILRDALGDDAPPVVLLSRTGDGPKPRDGVVAIAAARFDEQLLALVDQVIKS